MQVVPSLRARRQNRLVLLGPVASVGRTVLESEEVVPVNAMTQVLLVVHVVGR